MKKNMSIVVFLSLFALHGCKITKKADLLDVYAKAKYIDTQLLFGIVIDTRGINDSGKYIVRSIRYFEKNSNSFLLYPGIDTNSIKSFCESKQIGAKEVDKLVKDLLDIHSKLNVYEISSLPKLGDFIVFSCDNGEKLVYVPDINKVINSYWIYNLQKGKKLDSMWYIINGSNDM